jgi:hypothetical protein
MRTDGEFGFEWLAATPRGQRGFDRVVQGLEPQPASELRGVGVDASGPVAQVDEVVLPPAPAPDGGGFPWILLLIPAGAAVAAAAWRLTKPRLGRTAAHGPLPGHDVS